MANSRSFIGHSLDLLSLLGPVLARPMFGGHGLYCRGVMFGLLDDDELFLKTDALSRERFAAEACRMWVYPGVPETSYYRPPDDAHEDAESMLPWARLGLEAALRLKAAKEEKARAAAERRAAREAKRGAAKAAGAGSPRRRPTPAARARRGARRRPKAR